MMSFKTNHYQITENFMDPAKAAALSYLTTMYRAFDQVVEWVFKHGSLSQFPRIVHYLCKQNGGTGWTDSYQNTLVLRLLESKWMQKDEKDPYLFMCVVDGSWWHWRNEEWRMCAYRESLIQVKLGTSTTALSPRIGVMCDQDDHFFSDSFFRTAGIEPEGVKKMDLEGIVQYLTLQEDGSYLKIESTFVYEESEQQEEQSVSWNAVLRYLFNVLWTWYFGLKLHLLLFKIKLKRTLKKIFRK